MLRCVSKRVSTVATEFRWPELTAIHESLAEFDCEFGQWQTQFETLLDETAEELRRGNIRDEHRQPIDALTKAFVEERQERRQYDCDILTELRELRRLIDLHPRTA